MELEISGKKYLLKLNVEKIKKLVAAKYPEAEKKFTTYGFQIIISSKILTTCCLGHKMPPGTSVIYKNYRMEANKLLGEIPQISYNGNPACPPISGLTFKWLGLCRIFIFPNNFAWYCRNINQFKNFVIYVLSHECGHFVLIDNDAEKEYKADEQEACEIGLNLIQGNAKEWLETIQLEPIVEPVGKISAFYIPPSFNPIK